MEQGKTILVVDDEIKITEVLKSYLEKAGYHTVCAFTGREALNFLDRYAPVLVVLDLMLPDLSGEEVCRAIRAKSRVPVIMLTAKIEEKNILRGLEIGADDYVTKPFSPRQIVARVNAVLRRMGSESQPVADRYDFNGGELMIDNLRHEVFKYGEKVNLTPNEFKILMALCKFPTKAFTREEIIGLALGDLFDGFDRVVDTHIKNLRQKIEPDAKTPKYILTVYGLGYKFGGGHP